MCNSGCANRNTSDRPLASGEKATGLRRGLDILVALGEDEALHAGGLGVIRLTERVGGDKSRVSRTLQTLAEYDLVARDPDTLAYRFGWRLYALARRFADARLLEAAPAHVERLGREFDEAAHVSVLSGAEALTILSRAPSHAVQATGWVGRTVPVRDFGGGIVAALNISAPGFRFADRLPAAGARVKAIADELSATLGWTSEPVGKAV